MKVLQDNCRESRFLASCELDDELSELDAARLRGHLAECADCARWAAETRSATELLRAAEPALHERDVRLPVLRRRLSRASGLVAAGTSGVAAAVAAALVALPSATVPGSSSPAGAPAPLTSGSGCTACTEGQIVLTAFKQALVTPWPSGVENPSVGIE